MHLAIKNMENKVEEKSQKIEQKERKQESTKILE